MLVPLDPPKQDPITGYEFWDDESDNVITVETIQSGKLVVIQYCDRSIELTRREACTLIRALTKVVEEHMTTNFNI